MRERILVLAPIPSTALDRLRDRFDLIEAWNDPPAFLHDHPTADTIRVVFTIGNESLTREIIDRLPALAYVCHYGVGHDLIDLTALRERGILITNTAGGNASCVADLAMTMLAACARQLIKGDRFVRDGRWSEPGAAYGFSNHLGGRKVGLYGLGQIGGRIARRAAAFEMEVGYHARHPKPDTAHRYFSSLLSLAEWADDLVIAAKATSSTVRSVDGAVLAALGRGGYLVNVARGSIVHEGDLIAALGQGTIAGAALDTFENEPAIAAQLRNFDNVILSPHAAAFTARAWKDTDAIFLANLERYFSGQAPINVVR